MAQNKLSVEAQKIYEVLLNGTPAAKCEIIARAIMDDQPDALRKILNSMPDAEYYHVMPCA